jgi:parallel beta-helix repeat protein
MTCFLGLVITSTALGQGLHDGPASKADENAATILLHGASGGDVLDCSLFADLQSCHDALPASGGTLILPPKTNYLLTSSWNITRPNVKILGAGIGSTVIGREPGYSNSELMRVSGSGFYITGVTFDGNGVPVQFEEVVLLGRKSIVDGIEIVRNTGIALACAAADVKIINSRFVGLASPARGSMGIWFDHLSINGLIIANNDIRDQRLNGIFGSGKNILIQENRLSGNHRQIYPTGGGQIDIKGLSTNANIRIIGNTITQGGDIATSGAEIEGPDVTLAGNNISGNIYSGIVLQAGRKIQVSGNRIYNNGNAERLGIGILVKPGVSHFRISDNAIWDDQELKTQAWGITIAKDTSHYVIHGNDLRGNLNPTGLVFHQGRAKGKIYANLPQRTSASTVPITTRSILQ